MIVLRALYSKWCIVFRFTSSKALHYVATYILLARQDTKLYYSRPFIIQRITNVTHDAKSRGRGVHKKTFLRFLFSHSFICKYFLKKTPKQPFPSKYDDFSRRAVRYVGI